jgi:hypothetical protein
MSRLLLSLLAVAVLLAVPSLLHACPACADAIANSGGVDADDVSNFPSAMNQSIYLMLSVPYATLAIVGFLIYRGCKKNAEYLDGLGQATDPVAPTA